MDTTKAYFIKRANRHGVLLVRERNPSEDFTGWGALEFTLNNGEVFVISGYPFGQGEEEDGLWVDMNLLDEETLNKIKAKTLSGESVEVNIQKSVEDYLSSRWKRQIIQPEL